MPIEIKPEEKKKDDDFNGFEKGGKWGGEPEVDPDQIFAIQIEVEDGYRNGCSWFRVTKMRFIDHEGPGASGSKSEVISAIADHEGVPESCVKGSSAYVQGNHVMGFGIHFPMKDLEQALEYTERTRRRAYVEKAEDKEQGDYSDGHAIKNVRKHTKRKLVSTGHCRMSIDKKWHFNQGRLSYNPEKAEKAAEERIQQLSNRQTNGVKSRRCRIDWSLLNTLYRTVDRIISDHKLFRSTDGYLWCRASIITQSATSREGETIAIWKMVEMCKLLYKKPIYRTEEWCKAIKEIWTNHWMGKKKDPAMRHEFLALMKREVRAKPYKKRERKKSAEAVSEPQSP